MARVTASKNSRLKKKPEIEIDDCIRRLVKCVLEMKLKDEYKKVELEVKYRAEIVGLVTDSFGDALYTLADCAVHQEIELKLAETEAEEEANEKEPEESDYQNY